MVNILESDISTHGIPVQDTLYKERQLWFKSHMDLELAVNGGRILHDYNNLQLKIVTQMERK
jgi:hypothetical protein